MAWARVVLIGPAGTELATWLLTGPGAPDLATVDALARWQLAARPLGGSIRLRDVSPELAGLLELVGLRREVGAEPAD